MYICIAERISAMFHFLCVTLCFVYNMIIKLSSVSLFFIEKTHPRDNNVGLVNIFAYYMKKCILFLIYNKSKTREESDRSLDKTLHQSMTRTMSVSMSESSIFKQIMCKLNLLSL